LREPGFGTQMAMPHAGGVVNVLSLATIRVLVLGVVGVAVTLVSCAPSASSAASADPFRVDIVVPVRGVPDRGDFPAVVAIDRGGGARCSGALVAPDVVLTARHCVAQTAARIDCPPALGEVQVAAAIPSASLRVTTGEDVSGAPVSAVGRQVLVPAAQELCGADVALLLLDRELDVEPFRVSATGAAQGAHVVTVGYGGDGVKRERDHAAVSESTATEIVVEEAPCQGDSGGPAVAEDTGEIVGVASRAGLVCDGSGAHRVYTRADVYGDLVAAALARGAASKRDGGASKRPRTDVGAACQHGADCAAGVCVDDQGHEYCSRTCDAADNCPSHYRCEKDREGHQVCVEH
jgi:secreted trypsin-like serine protease